jgi:hypothetical protein
VSTEAAPVTAPVTAPPVNAPVTTTAAPAFTTWDSADGKLNPAFYEKLPDDVKYIGDTLKKYQTREELVRGFANLSTLAGKKGLIPLAADAPPEAKADRKALLDGINGVPKEAKDYGLKRPDNIPEGAWNQPLADNFTNWAWKHSVSPSSMQELVKLQSEALQGNLASQKQYETDFWAGQATAFAEQTRKEGVQPDRATELAERGATALGFDLTNEQDQLVLKNAKVRLAMMRHALATGEDSFVQGQAARSEGADAGALMNSAMHNQADPLYKPLYDPAHPQHKMAKEKVDGWVRQVAAKNAAKK